MGKNAINILEALPVREIVSDRSARIWLFKCVFLRKLDELLVDTRFCKCLCSMVKTVLLNNVILTFILPESNFARTYKFAITQ